MIYVSVPQNVSCFRFVHHISLSTTSHMDIPMVKHVALPWHLKPQFKFFVTEITVSLSYQDQ